jgi:hypothetical protein
MLSYSFEKFYPEAAKKARQLGNNISDLNSLSKLITSLTSTLKLRVVILIDEVDKSSNNQLFLSFLGMLRDKYLAANDGEDSTFHSVILSGVHDVKSLKLRVRDANDTKLNSPWNIAADFNIDMSFNPSEIATMLNSYALERGVQMDISALAERIYYYTNGYPFLVSKICKNIDEEEIDQNPDFNPQKWTVADIDWSFRWLTRLMYTTTNFDDMIKNLEHNKELYKLAFDIVISGIDLTASLDNPAVNIGVVYGIFTGLNGKLRISNRIYEQRLYNYMVSKQETTNTGVRRFSKPAFVTETGDLDVEKVLTKFQAFMKEHYAQKDDIFLERHGRLLFMYNLKPILNGEGFDFKEPVIGDERRTDLVVTFNRKRYVIELKRWEGEKAHQAGLDQLSEYLDLYSLKEGYLLIFDFRKNKTYKSQKINHKDKTIIAVWV